MLCIYATGLSIPYIKQYICPAVFLNKVMNLSNSAVNPVHLHKAIYVLMSSVVPQIIFHVMM